MKEDVRIAWWSYQQNKKGKQMKDLAWSDQKCKQIELIQALLPYLTLWIKLGSKWFCLTHLLVTQKISSAPMVSYPSFTTHNPRQIYICTSAYIWFCGTKSVCLFKSFSQQLLKCLIKLSSSALNYQPVVSEMWAIYICRLISWFSSTWKGELFIQVA